MRCDLREEECRERSPTLSVVLHCRQLKSLGQKLGAAAALVHISRRHDSHLQPGRQDKGGRGDKGGREDMGGRGNTAGKGDWMLRVANVGDTEVVLCHHGRVIPLTRQFDVMVDAEECQRVIKSGGIVTEVSIVPRHFVIQ